MLREGAGKNPATTRPSSALKEQTQVCFKTSAGGPSLAHRAQHKGHMHNEINQAHWNFQGLNIDADNPSSCWPLVQRALLKYCVLQGTHIGEPEISPLLHSLSTAANWHIAIEPLEASSKTLLFVDAQDTKLNTTHSAIF